MLIMELLLPFASHVSSQNQQPFHLSLARNPTTILRYAHQVVVEI